MTILRTPDGRFQYLDGFPYTPHYVEIGGLRVHYVDEGRGDPILCLHGEPSWSYLYRHMIPALSANHRVVAPDWIGFGRSDKLPRIEDYSFNLHHDLLAALIDGLELQRITLVCQDWGGLLGLTIAAEMPERFARLVIMNTYLPTGEEPLSEGFILWRAYAERLGTALPVGRMMARTFQNERSKTPAVRAAYEAPFPDDGYKAGVAAFPLLVPLSPNDPGAARMRAARQRLGQWDRPALVLFSDGDPITAGADVFFRKLIPGAAGQPVITIEDAGHFLQEDRGEEIAAHILAFLDRTGMAR
jgi:haloalkane dehalogenase